MPSNLPSAPGVRSQTFRLSANSAVYSSPITRATQVAARYGAIWTLEIELPPMNRYQAGQWFGLIAGLNGVAGAVYAGPHAPRPVDYYDANVSYVHPNACSLRLKAAASEYALRWIETPAPLVNGASQTGENLVTDGWSAGDGLNAGDYLSFENGTFRELHQVTADCFADASGNMTIPIAPRIRRSPADNAAITLINPTGEFIAADNDQAAEEYDSGVGTRSISLSFSEFIR